MEIDIRGSEKVNSIRFADETVTFVDFTLYQADIIRLREVFGRHEVQILESHNCDYVRLNSKQHAENLIKALEKAIDLGWLK